MPWNKMWQKVLLSISLSALLALAACSGTITPKDTAPVSLDESAVVEVEPGPSLEDTPIETEPPEASEGEEMSSEPSPIVDLPPAPEFPVGLDWLNTNTPLTLAQLKGKVVLLDFWTYGCINCIHVIPDLKRLEAEYPDELVVIGVHSAKFENEADTENIRQIILRYELEHPVVNDSDFIVWQNWGVRAWPTAALIDPAGNIFDIHIGEGYYLSLKPKIEFLVDEFEARGLLDRTPLTFKLEKEGLPETVLSFPGKVLADEAGGRLFIADTNHNRIVIADIDSGDVLNVIGNEEPGSNDGDFRTATFRHPQGMTLSDDGQTLYVADTENRVIRQIDLLTEDVITLGHILNSPWDLELDGEQLYIAMAGSHQIWVLDLAAGIIDYFAGSGYEGTIDGPLAHAELAQPSGLTFDGRNRLYFADSEGSSIRWAETDPVNGKVGTLVGSGASLFDFGDVDGIGEEARLQHPLGIVYYKGTLYVADTYNSKIKQVDPKTAESKTLLGSEQGWRDGTDPLFYEPGGIDASRDKLYVADTNNHAIRVIDLNTKKTSTIVLKGIERFTTSANDFIGKVVLLDPGEIATGSGKVLLDVTFPDGYKVTDLAPFSMKWNVEGDAATLAPDASRSITAPQFPLEIDATFYEGEGKLTGDLTIYYCTEEVEGICLIEQVRLEIPLKVGDSGGSILTLTHNIELP